MSGYAGMRGHTRPALRRNPRSRTAGRTGARRRPPIAQPMPRDLALERDRTRPPVRFRSAPLGRIAVPLFLLVVLSRRVVGVGGDDRIKAERRRFVGLRSAQVWRVGAAPPSSDRSPIERVLDWRVR